ncbi:hypothetical protein MHYP_G00244190 [Metynnis hypsauchen]
MRRGEERRWSVVCHSVTSSTVARRLRLQGQRSSRHTHTCVIKVGKIIYSQELEGCVSTRRFDTVLHTFPWKFCHHV